MYTLVPWRHINEVFPSSYVLSLKRNSPPPNKKIGVYQELCSIMKNDEFLNVKQYCRWGARLCAPLSKIIGQK